MIDRRAKLQPDGTIEGVLALVDAPNRNGHTYPRAELEKMIAGMAENIRTKRAFVFSVLSVGSTRLADVGGYIQEAFIRESDEGAAAVIKVQPIKTPGGQLLTYTKDYGFHLVARGSVDEGGIIKDAAFDHVCIAGIEDL